MENSHSYTVSELINVLSHYSPHDTITLNCWADGGNKDNVQAYANLFNENTGDCILTDKY